MGKRVSIKHKRREAPEWVFSWRRLRESSFRKWCAMLAVGGAFALFVTSVRIRVSLPMPWTARKASVIHLTDDAEGRALTLRAREGGPFPSRFEPTGWDGIAAMENAAFEAVRVARPSYVPALRVLPDGVLPPLQLAAKGKSVLPKRSPVSQSTPVSNQLKLAPVLHPLSGITTAMMPRELPPFGGAVDVTLTSELSRFLLRIGPDGGVQDCISLVGGDESGSASLDSWLRGVTFHPEPKKPLRWIAIGVGFINQAANGPDVH